MSKAPTKGKNPSGEAAAVGDRGALARGWRELAPVLAAYQAAVVEIERFESDPDGKALINAADLARELHSVAQLLSDSIRILSAASAGALAD